MPAAAEYESGPDINRGRLATLLPGPTPLRFIGEHWELVKWQHDPIGYLERAHQRYGLISGVRTTRPRVYLFGPEANQFVFGNPDLFLMNEHSSGARSRINNSLTCLRSGLLTLDGAEHRQHRRIMAPAFGHTQVERHHKEIVSATESMLAAWMPGEMRDVEREIRNLVHRIALKVVLGVDGDQRACEITKAVDRLLAAAPRAMMFPVRLPGTSYSTVMSAADKILLSFRALMSQKEHETATIDALSIIIRARNETGEKISDDELIGEAYNVLCHESTASALTWAVFLLSMHPHVNAALAEEINCALLGNQPGMGDLDRLPYLDQVIKEVLRLMPPAPFARRVSSRTFSFCGLSFPRGTTVIASQYITQRMPEIFAEPKRFLPPRWETCRPSSYEYFPFGIGVHNCIGGHFAITEMKIVLAMLVARYRLVLPQRTRVDRRYELSLRPKRGMPMSIVRQDRGGSQAMVSGNITEMIDLNEKVRQ